MAAYLIPLLTIYKNGNIIAHFKFADECHRIAGCISIKTADNVETGCHPAKASNSFDSVFS